MYYIMKKMHATIIPEKTIYKKERQDNNTRLYTKPGQYREH